MRFSGRGLGGSSAGRGLAGRGGRVGGRWLLLAVVAVTGVAFWVSSLAGASQQQVRAEASGDLGVSGLSEAQLRAWETKVLGPEHAAEHAALRRDARLHKNAPTGPVGGFRLYARSATVAPEVGGRWNGRFDIPVMGINAAMLPTGKVLWYAYPNEPDSAPRRNEGWAVLWDPSKGTGADAFKRVDPPVDPATGAAGQHLVLRNLVPGRRARAGDGRQPLLYQRPQQPVRGPEPGVHVQPVQRDLDAAARYGPRPLVSRPRC